MAELDKFSVPPLTFTGPLPSVAELDKFSTPPLRLVVVIDCALGTFTTPPLTPSEPMPSALAPVALSVPL